MAYLGNDLQVAFPSYRNIDDISGSFDGIETSFALTVDGVAPVPAPINSQQCLISVNGVVQRPDDSGTEGFRLSGGNIIFASAPAGGVDFFGVILAGADYVNVGANFPSGTASAPSITFDSDLDTGIYNPAGNEIGFTTGGTRRLVINSSGQTSSGLGTAAAPAFSFISDPNTGVYSPGADQVAISTNGTGRLFVDANGNVGIGPTPNNYANYSTLTLNGTTGGIIDFEANGTIYGELQALANEFRVNAVGASSALKLYAGGAERLRITSAGLIGIGTSSPSYKLDVSVTTNDPTTGSPAAGSFVQVAGGTTTVGNGPSIVLNNASGAKETFWRMSAVTTSGNNGDLVFNGYNGGANYPERLRITAAGNVGIGTTSPASILHCASTGDNNIRVVANGATAQFGVDVGVPFVGTNNGPFNFYSNGQIRATLDSSGRLLVGTSTGSYKLEVADNNEANFAVTTCNNGSNNFAGIRLFKSRGTQASPTVVSSGDTLSNIIAYGHDGTTWQQASYIRTQVDGTPGPNDMPGRIVFSTTADGASSPTERMRINSAGAVFIGKTADTATANGAAITDPSGDCTLSLVHNSASSGHRLLALNRQNSDGTLVEFYQANTLEGSISVSGTTVTYGGGHLARWSQLPDNEDPSQLLKGTVMTNLDEMCEWGDEENEQLNKTKMSDVEGDKNVAGVFVSTSFSEDGPLDFFVGMTGDMVIRIGAGVTVERGDLLMSAGDGTAKPQDDDIIRSKTIAKVTSTNVSCTYDDGSYCVPCVLMAC